MNINDLADRHVGHAEEDDEEISVTQQRNSFKWGMLTALREAWKHAQGEDLPEIDREVIVLVGINSPVTTDSVWGCEVAFAHRPNPDGWDGKNIDTNEVTHYTPKLYDKGGWNAPDIAYWLDIELPKEIEL